MSSFLPLPLVYVNISITVLSTLTYSTGFKYLCFWIPCPVLLSHPAFPKLNSSLLCTILQADYFPEISVNNPTPSTSLCLHHSRPFLPHPLRAIRSILLTRPLRIHHVYSLFTCPACALYHDSLLTGLPAYVLSLWISLPCHHVPF